VEVRPHEVGHSLKALLPYKVPLIPNRENRDRQCCCSGEVVLAQGGEGDVAIVSTPVPGSQPMMDPDHGFEGLKGIITRTSHLSKRWAMDSRQR
jgi:hypothetical protein